MIENRNNSANPYIGRLEYNGVYIYLIRFYIGCDCGYLGCDNYKLVSQKIKVRTKTGEIVSKKNGGTVCKLPKNEIITEDLAIKYYKENYI